MEEKKSFSPSLLLLLFFSILFYFYVLYLLIIGSIDIDFFDETLQILIGKYFSLGFTPYRDFGVVYPPGNMFLSSVFTNGPMVNKFFFYAIFYLILNIAGWYGILKFRQKSRAINFELAVYLICNALVIYVFGVSGIFHLFILQLLLIISLIYLKEANQLYLPIIFLLNLIIVWFRWDWPLFLIMFCWLSLLPLLLFKWPLRKSFLVALVSSFGYFCGLLSMYVYLSGLGVVDIASKFIVLLPLTLTRTYRNLPLPTVKAFTDPNLAIYVCMLLIFVAGYVFVKKILFDKNQKSNFGAIFLLISYVFSFLAYALGRSDSYHFIPLWCSLCLAWIISCLLLKAKSAWRYLIIVSFFPMVGWFNQNSLFLKPIANYGENKLKTALLDCEKVTEGLNPSSVFVGRLTYERYLYNISSLYLIFPNVKPASPFLAEEPGIQNTCEHGSLVAEYLKKSEKPMLAFLELGIHPFYDNKETASMKSCGIIENYLKNSDYQVINRCSAYGFPFEVRIYK